MKTILFIVIFIIASYGCATNTFAAERTVTISGRVDVSGLDKASGSFTVRALQPQKRNVELARSTTDGAGNFQLSIDGEALALYGVVLEASSTGNRALVLEAAVLRARDAAALVVVDPSSTLEAAILGWKIQSNDGDFDTIRPGPLSTWLRPIAEPKTRDRLKRAYVAIAQWAAAVAGSQTTATVLRAAVGDVRFVAKRLGDLGVPADAVARLNDMSRKDPEVAYVLMMPYFLDL